MDEIQSKSLEFFKKGDEYYNSNDFNEAIRFYNKAISIDPFISHVYNNKGFFTFKFTISEYLICEKNAI